MCVFFPGVIPLLSLDLIIMGMGIIVFLFLVVGKCILKNRKGKQIFGEGGGHSQFFFFLGGGGGSNPLPQKYTQIAQATDHAIPPSPPPPHPAGTAASGSHYAPLPSV